MQGDLGCRTACIWDTRSGTTSYSPLEAELSAPLEGLQRGSPATASSSPRGRRPQDRQRAAAQLARVRQHSLRDSHALQESGCFRGKAKPLSIAASLMMGSFTTTQSLSWKEAEHQLQGRPPSRSGPSPTPCGTTVRVFALATGGSAAFHQ